MLLMHKVLLRILFLIPVIVYANDPFEEINREVWTFNEGVDNRIARPCLLYTSPSPRDATLSRMPSSA